MRLSISVTFSIFTIHTLYVYVCTAVIRGAGLDHNTFLGFVLTSHHSIDILGCPECFRLIQVAVNKLRIKMKSFNITADFTKAGGLRIRDKNFEAALKALTNEINDLMTKMKGLLNGDDDLFKFFASLKEQFKVLTDGYSELERMMDKSEGASKAGQNDVRKSENIIDMIKALLKLITKKLSKEGRKISEKATSGSGDVGDLSKKMREIAEEVNISYMISSLHYLI